MSKPVISKTTVGSGITKRTRETLTLADMDFEAWENFKGDYVDPVSNFSGWLSRFEKRLADTCSHFNLPTHATDFIFYDESNRRDWYRPSDDEIKLQSDEGDAGIQFRLTHRYSVLKKSLGYTYLKTYPEQDSFWYLGELMLLALNCRQALTKKDWLGLAGRSLKLGQLDREYRLKFSGEALLKRFEEYDRAHTIGTNKGIKKGQENARARRAIIWRIIELSGGEIDPRRPTEAARLIRERWPAGGPSVLSVDVITRILRANREP